MPHAKKIFLPAILGTCATGSPSMPYMKCFHDNELCCSQNKLLCEQLEVDYHLEQCTSSQAAVTVMPFQVMETDHVVAVCEPGHLGPQ